MSKETQIRFEQVVHRCYDRHCSMLLLKEPVLRCDGYISTATMAGTKGVVEILCGPPEYHAELLIVIAETGQRWNLADLVQFDTVKRWFVAYAAAAAGSSEADLEADVEWIFMILVEGLNGVKRFEWIRSVER
jgi:hypothetical protein